MIWELQYKIRMDEEENEYKVKIEIFSDVRAAQFAFFTVTTNEAVDEAVLIANGGAIYGEAVLLAYSNDWNTNWLNMPDWVE